MNPGKQAPKLSTATPVPPDELLRAYCTHRVEKHSEAIPKINEKERGDPLVMSAIVTGGDGSIFAIPDPHPTPNLLITKTFLLINDNSIPLTTQAFLHPFLSTPYPTPWQILCLYSKGIQTLDHFSPSPWVLPSPSHLLVSLELLQGASLPTSNLASRGPE